MKLFWISLNFIDQGYAFRNSEIIRFSKVLDDTKNLYSPEIVEEIENRLSLLNSKQFQPNMNEIKDLFLQKEIGINDSDPYGFEDEIDD